MFSSFFSALIVAYSSGFGITAGAHRLWSHRAYKAKWPLRLLLVILFTISGQVREQFFHILIYNSSSIILHSWQCNNKGMESALVLFEVPSQHLFWCDQGKPSVWMGGNWMRTYNLPNAKAIEVQRIRIVYRVLRNNSDKITWWDSWHENTFFSKV